MSLVQQMHFQAGVLHVEATGAFTLDEAKRAFLQMLGFVAQYQAKKVLLDGRAVTGKPGDWERFCYGQFAAKETMMMFNQSGIAPKFAYVIEEPLRDPHRFGETIAVNRGMNVRVFERLEEAFEWLAFTPTTKREADDVGEAIP